MSTINYTYNVIVDRFRQFAAGHFQLRRFTHGEISQADLEKEAEWPWLHVKPRAINYSPGTRSFQFEIFISDLPRDKEDKTGYQAESITDCSLIFQDLINEIYLGNMFGTDVVLTRPVNSEPFVEQYTHTLTGVTGTIELQLDYDWSACSIPASWNYNTPTDSGSDGWGALQFIESLDQNGAFVSLLNDVEAPGNSYYYGTNASGVKGWYAIVDNVGLTCETLPDCATIISIVDDIAALQSDKVDKIAGKGLSTEDYTTAEKSKLAGIQAGAEVNVNADWNATSGDAQILNKPTIPSIAGLVPDTRTITINGTTQDLSANRTFSVGTFNLPALTSGSVLFSNGTTIAQDNSNLFWDDTNNRLGIGTNAPLSSLHIEDDSAGDPFLFYKYSNNPVIAGGFLSSKLRGTKGSPSAVLSGDRLLSILGRGYRTTGGAGFNSYSAAITFTASENYTSSANGSYITLETTQDLTSLRTEKVRILGNGYVGIGTTTPSSKLTVIDETVAEIQSAVCNNTPANAGSFLVRKSRGSIASPSALLAGDRLGAFIFSGNNTGSGFHNPCALIGFAAENFTGSAAGGYFAFETTANGTTSRTEKMRLLGNGNLLINTTTDAGFRLDVNGTLRVNNTAYSYFVSSSNTAGSGAIKQGFVNGSTFTIDGANGSGPRLGLSSTPTGGYDFFEIGAFASANNFATKARNFRILSTISSVEDARLVLFAGTGNLILQNGGTFTDIASARLAVNSTTQGFLPPRMTTTQKNAIASPATGLMVYDTTLNLISVYNGTTWITL